MWRLSTFQIAFFGVCASGLIGASSLAAQLSDARAPGREKVPKLRQFEFYYGASIKELPAGAEVRVWAPRPRASRHQTARVAKMSFPIAPTTHRDPKYGNQMFYFEAEAPESGEIEFSVAYEIERREIDGLTQSGAPKMDPRREVFLAANNKVPIGGKPLELLAGFDLPKDKPLEIGRVLYDKVEDHMKYDKSKPGYGTGDAVWACDSRFGNCTDFHSLFISLARSHGLPARFEIGFPLPAERGGEGEIGGYHCWAHFFVDELGWVPVDISEADKHPQLRKYYFGNLTENRVAFTVGRDITLVPKQRAEPLNFFVYPHIEVDGKVWPATKTTRRFKFKDKSK